jgi:hypothetical protein
MRFCIINKETPVKKTMLAIAVGNDVPHVGGCRCRADRLRPVQPCARQPERRDRFRFRHPDRTIKLRDNNNSSRLGVKGSEELGVGDLKVIYQMEYGVDPDGRRVERVFQAQPVRRARGRLRPGQSRLLRHHRQGHRRTVDQFNDTSAISRT